MAFILFSLKILIGLDDATEYLYVPRSGVDGVRWEEWCRQYVARMAEKAVTHHPTLCRLYPNSYIGREHSLLSNWDPSIGKSFTVEPKWTPKSGLNPETIESIHRILTPLVCQLPEPSWKPGLEAEAIRTGPPLVVLSESASSATLTPTAKRLLKKRRKTFNLVHTYRDNEMNLNSSESLLVKLLDDDQDQEPSALESISLYPSEKLKDCKKPEPWMSTINKLPDFNIWIYHCHRVTQMGNRKFDEFVQEKLPFSFVWLLGEMSHMIYQSKKTIYLRLTDIERQYAFKSRRNPQS